MTVIGPRGPGGDPDLPGEDFRWIGGPHGAPFVADVGDLEDLEDVEDVDELEDFEDVDELDELDDPDDSGEEDLELDAMFRAAGQELLDHIKGRMKKPDHAPAAPMPPMPPTPPTSPPSRLPPPPRPRAPRRPAVAEVHRSGRETFWTMVADEAFRLGTELVVQLTAAIDLALDLVKAIPEDDSPVLVRALARGLVGNLAAARCFEPGEARASLLAFACDGPVIPERAEAARITGRSRFLAFSVATVDRLLRELTDEPTPRTALARMLARHLARTVGRAQELQSALGIVRNAEGIVYINVSNLNLSRERLHAPDVPVGTLWSDTTVWPPGVGSRIRRVSRPVGGHVYRVEALGI